MIQNADIVAPTATISDEKTCIPVDTFFRPKIYKPKNVDSRKNANNPSAANGAPNMSPTNLEYSDQFVPNWNSITIPVATPTAKIRPSTDRKSTRLNSRHLGISYAVFCLKK